MAQIIFHFQFKREINQYKKSVKFNKEMTISELFSHKPCFVMIVFWIILF